MTNLTHNSFVCKFISILCMFPATSCSSSGESIVSIQHLVCVTLCRWPSSVQVGKELPDLHTRRKIATSRFMLRHVCLPVRRSMCLCLILVNDQLDAQFFLLYVYFNSLHVSSNLVLIIRRINCINRISGTLWPSSVQVGKFLPDLHTRRSPTQSDTCQMSYWRNWFCWW
jgi:hypothetical protein